MTRNARTYQAAVRAGGYNTAFLSRNVRCTLSPSEETAFGVDGPSARLSFSALKADWLSELSVLRCDWLRELSVLRCDWLKRCSALRCDACFTAGEVEELGGRLRLDENRARASRFSSKRENLNEKRATDPYTRLQLTHRNISRSK